jgi:hypothetical protein
LIFAHLALAAALILALAAALIFHFFAGAATTGSGEFVVGFAPLIWAHRFLAAAESLARADALMPRFFVGAAVTAGAGGEGAATALLERQTWLGPVQGLNLTFLIHTQNEGFVRRV